MYNVPASTPQASPSYVHVVWPPVLPALAQSVVEVLVRGTTEEGKPGKQGMYWLCATSRQSLVAIKRLEASNDQDCLVRLELPPQEVGVITFFVSKELLNPASHGTLQRAGHASVPCYLPVLQQASCQEAKGLFIRMIQQGVESGRLGDAGASSPTSGMLDMSWASLTQFEQRAIRWVWAEHYGSMMTDIHFLLVHGNIRKHEAPSILPEHGELWMRPGTPCLCNGTSTLTEPCMTQFHCDLLLSHVHFLFANDAHAISTQLLHECLQKQHFTRLLLSDGIASPGRPSALLVLGAAAGSGDRGRQQGVPATALLGSTRSVKAWLRGSWRRLWVAFPQVRTHQLMVSLLLVLMTLLACQPFSPTVILLMALVGVPLMYSIYYM